MKKKLVVRSILGVPIGMAIGMVITLIISFCMGDGQFYFVSPMLAEDWGSEVNAALVQMIGCGLYGAISAASSVLWEMERWSLLKITAIHFVWITAPTLGIAYLLYWMPHHWLGALGYLVFFLLIYVAIWCSIYFPLKHKIRRISQKITENNQ